MTAKSYFPKRCISLFSALWLLSCTAGYQNASLAPGQANLERRIIVQNTPDRPTILLAFSGGGARAAALSAAVLNELNKVEYSAADGQHKLTDDIKVISSVSGGSVTAAWFGLYGADRLPELKTRFLDQDNMGAIKRNLIDPLFWTREIFTSYSRIQALQELLDARLFKNARLADINQPGHPYVVFNASDMAGGETFAFTPSRFDDICTDFDNLPLSTAVAASAAFPILLAPVNLKNFQPDCKGQTRDAEWALGELHASQAQLDFAEYRNARYTYDLRHGQNTGPASDAPPPLFRDIRYLHLLDGGLADNLGINSVLDTFSEYSDTQLLRAINEGRIHKIVIIVVNARSDPPSNLYQEKSASGLFSQFSSVVSVPIDANSQNAQIVLNNFSTEIARIVDAAKAVGPTYKTKIAVDLYGVAIDFDLLATGTPQERALRDAAKIIPTSWNISQPQISVIDQVATQLLQNDGCYRLLLHDLGVQGAADPAGDAPSCRTSMK